MKTQITFIKLLVASLVTLLTTNINAQTWSPKATNFATPTGVNEIAIASDLVIWAFNKTTKVFSKSIDGGNTWTSGVLNVGGANTGVSGATATSALKAWVCTYDSNVNFMGIFATTDGGVTWTKQASAYNVSANSFPNIVKFFDDLNGITIGDPLDDGYEIYRTTNGGQNWNKVPVANIPAILGGEYGIAGYFDSTTDGTKIWFGSVYGGNSQRIFRSSDGGTTWNVTPISTINGGAYGITFKDANVGFIFGMVGTTFTIQKTTDAGVTFTPITATGITGNVFDLECVPNSNMIAVSALTSGVSYAYFQPSDSSLAFQSFTNQIFANPIAFSNFYTGFAGSTNTTATNGIFKFNNTVSFVGSNIGTPFTTDVDFTTADGFNYFLEDYTFADGTLKFRQNHTASPTGFEWSSASFPTGTATVGGALIPVDAGMYDVTFNILNLQYTFTEVLKTNTVVQKAMSLYPNPSNKLITIENAAPIKAIRIIDITGKTSTISNFQNNQVNVEQLANGIYTIQIETDTNVFSEKFIKN